MISLQILTAIIAQLPNLSESMGVPPDYREWVYFKTGGIENDILIVDVGDNCVRQYRAHFNRDGKLTALFLAWSNGDGYTSYPLPEKYKSTICNSPEELQAAFRALPSE